MTFLIAYTQSMYPRCDLDDVDVCNIPHCTMKAVKKILDSFLSGEVDTSEETLVYFTMYLISLLFTLLILQKLVD
jgi:hypothetical protein